MNRTRFVSATVLFLLVTAPLVAQTGERLDRGVVAMRRADGSVYVGWRLLAADTDGTAFHVYRLASGKAER